MQRLILGRTQLTAAGFGNRVVVSGGLAPLGLFGFPVAVSKIDVFEFTDDNVTHWVAEMPYSANEPSLVALSEDFVELAGGFNGCVVLRIAWLTCCRLASMSTAFSLAFSPVGQQPGTITPTELENMSSGRGGMVSAAVGSCALFATGGAPYALFIECRVIIALLQAGW